MGSYAYSEQKDQRVVAESAELVVSPEAVLAFPRSIAAGQKVTLSDVVFNEFPETVQKSISELVTTVSETAKLTQTQTLPRLMDSFDKIVGDISETFTQSISQAGKQSQLVTETLGDKLTETQLGQAAILPGMAKYLAVAVVVIILGRKFIK